ncbi:hypothetical protein [Hymenobacter persicinus]|uniref:Uncharacterized protein n=1 Tax=Hymenobacter persicinus TaxID=2025506 RepID=A0A4Q5LES2_9BACT|nr:hypothetical protein [Hymenobacter persicinus]RYU81257.1 hypothetical protein EWM57_06685 [Hymenobacter persicinus]
MKKKIPLAIHKAIEPLLPIINKEIVAMDMSANSLFRMIDVDPESGFFFEITAIEKSDGKTIIRYESKPASANNNIAIRAATTYEGFANIFKQWINILNDYNQIPTIFDDPILKQYEDDFQEKFESADENASRASFTLEQQFLLDDAFTKIIFLLEHNKDKENIEEIDSLIVEAKSIQDTITTSTKDEIFGKMSSLFSKIQKGGLKWIKEIYPIIQKEIISQIVKGALNLPSVIDIT